MPHFRASLRAFGNCEAWKENDCSVPVSTEKFFLDCTTVTHFAKVGEPNDPAVCNIAVMLFELQSQCNDWVGERLSVQKLPARIRAGGHHSHMLQLPKPC